MTTKKPHTTILDVPLAQLIEDPSNPNKMSEADFKLLVRNIEEHGFLAPILVKPHKGDKRLEIVDGHHRARGAALAGLKSVPAIVWDGTDEMRRAMAVAMNKIRGELDLGEVSRIFSDLHENGWTPAELTMTGYTEEQIEDLLKVAAEVGADAEEILEGSTRGPDEDTDDVDAPHRPAILELTFKSSDELQAARRALRRAAGKGRELGEGLLNLIGKGAED